MKIENNDFRVLDLHKLIDADYETLESFQWGGESPFAVGKFQTEDGKAHFIPTPINQATILEQSLILNTGRIRDQWHTMTRTGLVPKLFGHRGEPYLEISKCDAVAHALNSAELVEVSGPKGKSIARVLISDAVSPGSVFQPMHWSAPFASHGCVNAASHSNVDPISGQPALKSSLVNIRKFSAAWYACAITANLPNFEFDYWASIPLDKGHFFECAGLKIPDNWLALLENRFNVKASELTSVHSHDNAYFRCASKTNGRIDFAFFASKSPIEVSRNWLQAQLGAEISPEKLLAGRPAVGQADNGPIICACNAIGRNQIYLALYANPTASLSAICNKTNAGTGCGSCRPEVQRIINETAKPRLAAE